ncbi:mitogen-activated protein kinase binding protein 1 [Desmophyllum pertusum]|uniref:Mitogen-activated protein kinase binding protein 1 n=1 Tax=Desmophyllum pertusum TaxID=174260 RepID=A0A9X0CLE9_9CNID|nr:mitogen-activated protein kinase binding protein 1 [Desmophyllum pertusum]
MAGHSEVVTGLKFSVDCKNLISVGGDGCVFVWKVPTTYTQNMVEKLQALGQEPDNKIQFGTPIRPQKRMTLSSAEPSASAGRLESPVLQLEITALAWASCQPGQKSSSPEGNEKTNLSPEEDNTGPVTQPGGRWAQRVQNGGIHVAGDNGTIQPIPFSFEPADRKRYTIEPISLQEQMRALANSPLERRCSLTRGEDDDLFQFPAEGRAALDNLSENDNASDEVAYIILQSGV